MAYELPQDFTRLINDARSDPRAAVAVLAGAYQVFRDMARQKMAGERVDHTLCPTALINEVYPELFPKDGRWNDREHFFKTAAEAMRNILIDYARSRARLKRGSGRKRVDFETFSVADLADRRDPDLVLSIDDAICQLSRTNPQAGQVVRLKFYGGLNNDEVAEALKMSVETVKRRWRFARASLARALTGLRDTQDAPAGPEPNAPEPEDPE